MLKARRQTGTILAIVVLVGGLILLIIGLCLSFNGFLSRCSEGQDKLDRLAMQFARSINFGDRVGQINELTEGARELVLISRSNAEKCSDEGGLSAFSSLYEDLASEASEGQLLVESERRNQLRLISSEIMAQAQKYNASASASKSFQMFWLKTREPKIERVDVGTIRNMESNVQALNGIDELVESDVNHRFVDQRSGLYMPRTMLKLAALPASVNGVCAPMRNANPQAFVHFNTLLRNGSPVTTYMDKLPCAVQIWCTLETRVGRDGEHKQNVEQVATAVTTGSVCGH